MAGKLLRYGKERRERMHMQNKEEEEYRNEELQETKKYNQLTVVDNKRRQVM